MERGEFDDLPGQGEPLEILKEPYEPTWWVKRWAKREGITAEELREALANRRRSPPPAAGHRPPGGETSTS